MSVVRNVVFNPMLVPGGGAVEKAISVDLYERARVMTGIEAGPFRAIADALPRTLMKNVGGNAICTLTALCVRLFSSLSSYVFLILYYLFFSRQNM